MNGKIYLTSKLNNNINHTQTQEWIEFRATNGLVNHSITNRVLILNSNDKPPEFVNSQRVFQIQEV